jgi:hypothetical protein
MLAPPLLMPGLIEQNQMPISLRYLLPKMLMLQPQLKWLQPQQKHQLIQHLQEPPPLIRHSQLRSLRLPPYPSFLEVLQVQHYQNLLYHPFHR